MVHGDVFGAGHESLARAAGDGGGGVAGGASLTDRWLEDIERRRQRIEELLVKLVAQLGLCAG